MNLDDLKEILRIVQEHQLTEFELERAGIKIKIKKNNLHVSPSPNPITSGTVVSAGSLPPPAPALPESKDRPAEEEARERFDEGEAELLELAVVKSPIVGTFYRASDPSSPPFVEVGSKVHVGQVLCIIEAMKLMNEIDSEYEGEVVAVYVQNGQAVQYGERLFAIKVK